MAIVMIKQGLQTLENGDAQLHGLKSEIPATVNSALSLVNPSRHAEAQYPNPTNR